MLAEVVGGIAADSLALLADAGHMLSDVAAIALSLAALWISERPASAKQTFGYHRAEILAALANGALLGAISIYIVVEAIARFSTPEHVNGELMLIVAVGGLFVNLAAMAILHGGAKDSLNIRGAWLHVMSDVLGSIGAIVAGGLVWAFGWDWSDAVISIVISLLIVWSGWGLLRESVSILMESAPKDIDVDEVRIAMIDVGGVLSVHDLHVWTIGNGLFALAAHVVSTNAPPHGDLLAEFRTLLHERFGIDHITVQIEPEEFGDCECSASVEG